MYVETNARSVRRYMGVMSHSKCGSIIMRFLFVMIIGNEVFKESFIIRYGSCIAEFSCVYLWR